ncbi:MAG TPA: hypothetical protein VMG33_01115 [Steroidobacteraceae bacterium]|nr:hypothetical protein [Steroidobacteraceae bacterium]HUI61043.1 hypothetical protein [Steroidobacteraceae bacterium]
MRALLVLLAVSVLPLAAASAEPLSDDLQRCARETDEHLRLKCFDELAGSLPQRKRDEFGMTAAIAERKDPAAPKAPVFDPEVLDAKIAGLRQGSHGEYIFTLDNGQVWVEAESRPGQRFSVGEAVQIKHGMFSALWLSASSNRMIRVKRIS